MKVVRLRQRLSSVRSAARGYLGAVLGALVLMSLAAAAWWLRAPPSLPRFLPKDTQVYVEVPSLERALRELLGIDAIDEGALNADQQQKRLVSAFADSFELGQGNVERALGAIRSVAVAGRRMENPEVVILFAFGSAGEDVAKVLASRRFKYDGTFKGYTRYRLEVREDAHVDALAELPPLERAMDRLGAKPATDLDEQASPAGHVSVIWFEKERVLALGAARMVEDCARVVSGDRLSLAQGNDLFARADWPARSRVVGYIDPNLPGSRELRERLLDGDPATFAMRIIPLGVGFDLQMHLKGSALPHPKLFTRPTKLSLWERLPYDTIAYLAASTRFAATGKEVERALFDAAGSIDVSVARRLQAALDGMHREISVDFADLVEISGDQAVFAVVADDSALKAFGEGEHEALTFVGIAEVSDRRRAARLLSEVRDLLEREYDVSRTDGGFIATQEKQPSLLFKLSSEGHLLFARGSISAIDDFEDIYIGKGRGLSAETAHQRALGALAGRPQLLMWLDAGRISKTARSSDRPSGEAQDLSPRDAIDELGLPSEALDLDSPKRVTAAVALFIRASDKALDVEIKSLNAMALPALWPMLKASARARPKAQSETGVPACDAYLQALRECVSKVHGADKKMVEAILKTTLEQYKHAKPAERDALGKECAANADGMKTLLGCN